uniref:Uncharacterized protein n=1 Tax=Pristhesancus plagipennis TaxID=1955184 RepID=A0A2K8JLW0_PRIPG|nr:secreted hypothetical protein [Pristhesancus plagipennis]
MQNPCALYKALTFFLFLLLLEYLHLRCHCLALSHSLISSINNCLSHNQKSTKIHTR